MIPVSSPYVLQHEFENEYEKIKKSYEEKYGPDNVYFASFDFVDWANPVERGFAWGVGAILTGGANLIMYPENWTGH
jgi:hypothetical protein